MSLEEKTERFKAELKVLMDEYGAEIYPVSDYDGNDLFIATTYRISFDGDVDWGLTFIDHIKEIGKLKR